MPVTIQDVTLETVEAPSAEPPPAAPSRPPQPDMEAILVALRREQSRRERLWAD
jgi:hypothetical protein